MPVARTVDLAPDTTPIKLPGPLVQRIEIRAGDDLPGFAAIVEDDLGNPVDLTGAVAYFCLSDGGDRGWKIKQQCYIANPAAGVVMFDWTPVQTQTEWGIGNHPLSILARWPDGRELTAPSQRSSVTLTIRSGTAVEIPSIIDTQWGGWTATAEGTWSPNHFAYIDTLWGYEAPLSYTDNFNRPDSGILGMLWVPDTTYNSLVIFNNELFCVGGVAGIAFWNADLTANQFMEFDITGPLGGNGTYVLLRGDAADGSIGDCYLLHYDSSGTFTISKTVSGVNTTLNTTAGVGTPPLPFRVRFEAQGSTLRAYFNGVQKVSITDSSIPSGGYAGIYLTSSNVKVDNMTCGSL